jgi:WW domain
MYKKNYTPVVIIVIETQSQSAIVAPPISQIAGNNSTNNLMPLEKLEWPWEEGLTEQGERYYINHVNRTTTWRDPRLCTFMHSNAHDSLFL